MPVFAAQADAPGLRVTAAMSDVCRLKIIGNYISPYVRKVLVCLELKGIDYEIDPIAPFVGNDQFSQLSPLRRIPVLSTMDSC
jgi:hypothetical protein